VEVGEAVAAAVGDGTGVLVVVAVGTVVSVGVGVAVGAAARLPAEKESMDQAWTPSQALTPVNPAARGEASVQLSCQLAGSVAPSCHARTLMTAVVPEVWMRARSQ
jgi:hypothetical protein